MIFRASFPHSYLLEYAIQGRLGIMNAPPPSHCSGEDTQQDADRKALISAWFFQQLGVHRESSQALIRYCLDALQDLHPDLNPDKTTDALWSDTYQDLLSMQRQPSIMRGYRRFVLIEGSQDRSVSRKAPGVRCIFYGVSQTFLNMSYRSNVVFSPPSSLETSFGKKRSEWTYCTPTCGL